MRIIVFKTENAVFKFSRKDILEHLNLLATEHDGDETVRLLEPAADGLRMRFERQNLAVGRKGLNLVLSAKVKCL